MPKIPQERVMGTVLGVRLTAEESARLDALVAQIPIATKHRIARVALLRGLAELEANPTLLLRGDVPTKQRAQVAKRSVR